MLNSVEILLIPKEISRREENSGVVLTGITRKIPFCLKTNINEVLTKSETGNGSRFP